MYSDGEDLKWFNYTFMTYKDKSYGTDGYLRVSGSTSTSNFQNFNTFKIQLAISNKLQKMCSLGLPEIIDLTSAFDKVLTSFKTNGFRESEVERKVGKSINLIFKFFVDKNSNELLVRVELYSNESDFTRVIIPLQFEFIALSKVLRQYIDNAFTTGVQFVANSTNSIHLEQIPSLLKSLPSGIVSRIPVHEEPVNEELIKGAAETALTIDDLDKFMGPNMVNVKMPDEIVKAMGHEQNIEIKSDYIEKILKNDLTNLETFLNNITLSPSPVQMFAKEVSVLGDGDFKPLIGISENEKKSLLYMSKLYFSISHTSYMSHRVPLPHATPIFKYKAKGFTDTNLELAYDLLLISLYVRAVRRKLENSDSDAMTNCSLFHIQMRCFVDPFIFSFLDGIEPDSLHAICIQRFRSFSKIGFFNSYKKRLEDSNCDEIKEDDILEAVVEVTSKVLGKTPYILEVHESSIEKNSLRLPTDNNFTLEQITNEIIPLELSEKMGKDINDEEVIIELKSKHPISDEILNFFKQSKKKVKMTQIEKVSNLHRLCSHFDNEMPEQHKESFLSYIKELGDHNFNFVVSSFPLNEFGENIIKALYTWNPEGDSDMRTNYRHFFMKVEEEVMTKNLIIAKVGEDAFKDNSEDGWGDLLIGE